MKNQMDIFLKYKDIFLKDNLPSSDEFERKELNLNFSEINFLIHNFDEFWLVFSESITKKGKIIAKLYELIIDFGLVYAKTEPEKDLQTDDFPCTAEYAENVFKSFHLLFETWNNLESENQRQVSINVLLLCATHSYSYSWSNEKTIALSAEILTKFLVLSKYEDLCSLLCTNYHPTIFKGILKKIRPSLMKDTWLQYPSSCHVFSWFLHHVKHPYLFDYLNDVFPPPCMFISDHRICHQTQAIQCFQHILDNIPPTLIKLDGKENVIWNLLYPSIYSTEVALIEVLFPCLLKLPSFRSQKMTEIGWTHYDDTLNQLLVRAEMEFAKKSKYLYLTHIYSFIKITPPFKHLKQLMKVIETSFYKDTDTASQILSVKILSEVIKSCWPSVDKHCFTILKNIAVLLCEFESRRSQEKIEDIQELYNECEVCLSLVKYVCENTFKLITLKYVEENENMPGVEIFKSVLCKS